MSVAKENELTLIYHYLGRTWNYYALKQGNTFEIRAIREELDINKVVSWFGMKVDFDYYMKLLKDLMEHHTINKKPIVLKHSSLSGAWYDVEKETATYNLEGLSRAVWDNYKHLYLQPPEQLEFFFMKESNE